MDAAVTALRREQIMVTKIDYLKTPVKAEAAPKKAVKKGKSVPSKNLAIFTRQFSVMIDAGLPLVQCLEILGKQEPHKRSPTYILQVRGDVESGRRPGRRDEASIRRRSTLCTRTWSRRARPAVFSTRS